MTQKAMAFVHPEENDRAIALRVQRCLVGPQGQLVVAALGGRWHLDPNDVPRHPVWFEVDIPTAAATAKDGLVILPQSDLRQGAPDFAALLAAGYANLPFYEYGRDFSQPLDGEPTPGQPAVQIVYYDYMRTGNYPEQLGLGPSIRLLNEPALPPVAIEMQDPGKKFNAWGVPLVPLAAVGDVATGAVVVGGVAAVGAAYLSPIWVPFVAGGHGNVAYGPAYSY
jgi:hypothetical protein